MEYHLMATLSLNVPTDTVTLAQTVFTDVAEVTEWMASALDAEIKSRVRDKADADFHASQADLGITAL